MDQFEYVKYAGRQPIPSVRAKTRACPALKPDPPFDIAPTPYEYIRTICQFIIHLTTTNDTHRQRYAIHQQKEPLSIQRGLTQPHSLCWTPPEKCHTTLHTLSVLLMKHLRLTCTH